MKKNLLRDIEYHCRHNPEETAIFFQGKLVSYGELWNNALGLSKKIIASGPEEIVALSARRTPDFITGILAAFLADCAYYPIDTLMPQKRAASLLSKANVKNVISSKEEMEFFKPIVSNVIFFEEKSNPTEIKKQSYKSDLAYLLSTSGSTGEPKIVAIEHKSVFALLSGYDKVSPLARPLRSLALCPFSFDVSVLEIFSALIKGGSIVLLDEDEIKNPEEIANALQNFAVTSAYIPPFMLEPLADLLKEKADSLSLERLLVGVEPITEQTLQKWRDLSADLSIVNGYGPTEATICSTFYIFDKALVPSRRVPIGKAVDGWSVEIVDEQLQPVQAGEIGEIIIAGDGLARGYIGDDSSMEQNFIVRESAQNPLQKTRWYRTGDFAQFNENRDIVFCGRQDEQVKIRGFRIDLNEIEQSAKTCQGVRSAVVMAPYIQDGRRLYLFVEGSLPPQKILEHLVAELPAYMIPARIETMDSFPLTVNGKADRQKLLSIAKRRPLEDIPVAPTNDMEDMLAAAWKENLALDEIGVLDDFYLLGGDSRLWARLSIAMARIAGMEGKSTRFLGCKTIADCSRIVSEYKMSRRDTENLETIPTAESASTLLSEGQKGLWTLQKLNPDSIAFILPFAIMLKGLKDASFVRGRISSVLKRQGIFHSSVGIKDGKLSWVASEGKIITEHPTLVNEDDLDMSLSDIYKEDATAILQADGPLIHVRCIKTDLGNMAVLFTAHHLVIDGESAQQLVSDIIDSLSAGEDIFNDDDIVLPQEAPLSPSFLVEDEVYWKDLLASCPAPLSLWTPKPRSQMQRGAGTFEHVFTSAQTMSLSEIARSCASSRYEAILSLAAILALRMSGQDDFLISTPVSLRNAKDRAGLACGYLVNLLPIRVTTDHQRKSHEFVRHMASAFRDARRHGAYPFENMIKVLSAEGPFDASSLKRFVVAEDIGMPLPAKAADIEITEVRVARIEAMYELALFVSLEGDVPRLRWEYNSSLYGETSIQNLSDAYICLLEDVAKRGDISISRLKLLTVQEEKRLWEHSIQQLATSLPEKDTIKIFDEICSRNPLSPAVVSDEISYTYKELSVQSHIIADALINAGVRSGDAVFLFAARHPHFVACLLGILRAGGCYVPIDERVPHDRIAQIAKIAGISHGITTDNASSDWISVVKTKLKGHLRFVDVSSVSKEGDTSVKPVVRTIESPAYIMFTSGSTGIPKGVMIPDRGIIRLAKYPNFAEFSDKDVFVLLSNLAFDAATLEIWGALLNGGQIVVPPDVTLKDPTKITDYLLDSGITAGFFNVTLFRWIIETRPEALSSMHTILVGGEQVPPELFAKASRILQPHVLLNGYGPTENTTFTCCYRLKEGARADTAIPVGYALSYSATMVVDDDFRPVPCGAVGEIVGGGAGVSLGYIGNEEETKKRFIQTENAGTWYKTGDRGRLLPDGSIVCLGREDNQIKIRGFRIESEEIEATFRKQPGIQDVVVVAVDAEGGKRLEAYVEGNANVADLKKKLELLLPSYMIPTRIFMLNKIPVNQNGKKDKAALIAIGKRGGSVNKDTEGSDEKHREPKKDIYATLHHIFSEALSIDKIGANERFFDIGVNSMLLAILSKRISNAIDCEVSTVEILDNPTLGHLSSYLEKSSGDQTTAEFTAEKDHNDFIAVIGMSGRFSGCDDIDAFWKSSLEGRSNITTLQATSEGEVPYRGVLSRSDRFDADFFGITEREARFMDPQQRVLLEVCHYALENAAIDPERQGGRISVYAASAPSQQSSLSDSLSEQYEQTLAGSSEFVAQKLSYRLNLRGESITVQTGCSSSLVAVHMACQSLLSSKSDISMAAGVSFQADQTQGYFYEEGMITSPTGRCRPFDAAADGTVPGAGAASIVLMRLADAQDKNYPIHAVIRATALNNDGASKVGFMAPSPSGQADVISSAQKIAGVLPSDICYIETHGTGTDLGDAVEIEGISRIFGGGKKSHCALGSVKANCGHMDRAAGISGLIRAIMVVKTGFIPPLAGFEKLNPRLRLEKAGLYIPTTKEEWPSDKERRIAGVSSFGVGGTNSHVVIEGPGLYYNKSSRHETDPLDGFVLPLSAASEASFHAQARELANYWDNNDVKGIDVSKTLAEGRTARNLRACVYGYEKEGAIQALRSIHSPIDVSRVKKRVWVFPGQGDAKIDSYKALYHDCPVYKDALDYCSDFILKNAGFDIRPFLFKEDHNELADMSIFQPAMFAVQWAHACFWKDLGFKPDIVLGHSLGEVMAATVAGIFSLEDALRLVIWRSRLMQDSREAAMISVALPAEKIAPYLKEGVSISAHNGRNLNILSGEKDAIADIEQKLIADNITVKRLAIPRAAHSHFMLNASKELNYLLAGVTFKEPSIPIISNLSGTWGDKGMASADYWSRHITQPVLFSDSLQILSKEAANSYVLCVGPAKSIAHMVAYETDGTMARVAYLENLQADTARSLKAKALSVLWESGISENIVVMDGEGKRLSLPSTVFDHSRKWDMPMQTRQSESVDVPGLQRTSDPASWLWEKAERLLMSMEGGAAISRPTSITDLPKDDHALDDLIATAKGPILWKIQDSSADIFASAVRLAKAGKKHSAQIWLCPDHTDKDSIITPLMIAQSIQKVLPLEYPGISWPVLSGLFDHKNEEGSIVEALSSLKHLPEEIVVKSDAIYEHQYIHSWPDYVSRPLKKNGLYVLTGGAGRVARSMVQAISSRVDATVVLIGRRDEEKASADIQDIKKAIKNTKTQLRYVSLDITDKDNVISLFAELRREFGRIDGIIHAAGLTDTTEFSLMEDITEKNMDQVIKAKVEGCKAIEKAIADDDADFIILCSSLSTALGGVGFSTYIAANLYLDALATRKHDSGDKRWISAGWDAWKNRHRDDLSDKEGPGRFALNDQDGVDVFNRLLASKAPVILISTADISARRQDALVMIGDGMTEQNEFKTNLREVRSNSQTVRDVITSVLGKLPDDPDRDLREDGIESLTILQIVTRLKKAIHAPIPLTEAMRCLSLNGLEKLLEVCSKTEDSLPIFDIRKADDADSYPVSSLQRRWLILMPGEYGGLDIVVEVTSKGDGVSVGEAVKHVMKAHSSLRTRFPRHGDSWLQVIEEEPLVEEIDLTEHSLEDQTKYLRDLVEHKTKSWFEVEETVPFDVTVVRLSSNRHAIVIHAHHVLFDGTSSSIFLRDINDAFEGKEIKPAYQYIDYAVRQQAYLNSLEILPYREFWKKEFSGAPSPTRVPSDFPDSKDEIDDRGDFVAFHIDASTVRNIRRIAREKNATSFVLMMAAFGWLLHERTGNDDLVLGTTTAGRPNEAAENIVGVFVNPLPIRIRIPATAGFDEYIEHVRQVMLNLHEHQHYPMEDLIRHVPPFIGLGLNDTFQSYILYQNYWRPKEQELTFRKMDVGAEAHHKLMREYEFVLEDDEETISGEFWYRPSRFSRETAERDAKRFVEILEALSQYRLPSY